MIKGHAGVRTSRVSKRQARAFTLVEAVTCIVLVSVLFVAAVQAASLPSVIQFKAADRARGRAMAAALLNEVLQQKYSASSVSASSHELILGSSTEARAGNRLSFDDVDDYHNYTDSPPLNRDGAPIAGADAYRRTVTVARVSLANLSQASATETGAKRITVTVTRNQQVVSRMSALRADVPG